MKTIEDFDVKKYWDMVEKLGKEHGIEEEAKLKEVLTVFLDKEKAEGKTKLPCLTCGKKFLLSELDHVCQKEDIWLNSYIQDATHHRQVPRGLKSRLKANYPLKKGNNLAFRGMNFLTKESYEAFMESFQDGYYEAEELSSWSLSYDYAKRFARCIQRGTRINNEERQVAYEKMFQDSSFMTGYKGIILMADIKKKHVLCDISEEGIGDMNEYEVILLPGRIEAIIAHELDYESGIFTWTEEKITEARKGAGI